MEHLAKRAEQAIAQADNRHGEMLDIQVGTAKQYPRDVVRFKERLMTMATIDRETAESCYYTLKRKGKDGVKLIEGPSVRMAEIAMAQWGNMRCGAKPVHDDGRYVYAQATAWDMETNTAVQWETKRRVIDINGRRYSDDMVVVTTNAACAIAYREAIFKVVPRAFVKPVFEACKKVAVSGKGDRIERAVKAFAALGVDSRALEAYCGKPLKSLDDEDFSVLTGLRTALRDGDIRLEEILSGDEPEDVGSEPQTQRVLKKLREKNGRTTDGD